MDAGRWQKVMESEDVQTQAVRAGKTFCSLSELGIEGIKSGRLPPLAIGRRFRA